MSPPLKPGDRVRMATPRQADGFRAGDRGTVVKALLNPVGGDTRFYLVAMDEAGVPGTAAVLSAGEIEREA